jgi:hypothetical protein
MNRTIFKQIKFFKMKTTKMSLATIQGKLSRVEMKKIMAGSGESDCGTQCSGTCSLGNGNYGKCYTSPKNGNCYCSGGY